VPGFLFLDQPTQVYFPPDLDPEFQGNVQELQDDDRQKVARMFELNFVAVAELAPDFQVIVTNHADLLDIQDFQDAVIERWRGGNTLIPEIGEKKDYPSNSRFDDIEILVALPDGEGSCIWE
jgi:hypothetical protein